MSGLGYRKTGFNAAKMMNDSPSQKLKIFYLFYLVLSFSLFPAAFSQQKAGSEECGQEASASQAQATMASLFGRGAKMPGIPRINGTIALPTFDSSGMTIDEGFLSEVQRGRRSSENANTQR